MAEQIQRWAGSIQQPVPAWQRPVGGVVPAGPFEGFLTKEDVGRALRVPVRTVERWMEEGVLPFYKPTRAVRFRWSEVLAHWTAHYRVAAKRSCPASTQPHTGSPKA